MKEFNLFLIIFIFLKNSKSEPNCVQNQNHCQKCNPLTHLCAVCKEDNYFPDLNGGCEPKCTIGKNYCNLCNEDESLCESCEFGFFPDKIGGCTYVTNCETSYKGKCLTCEKDFILVQETGFCKSVHSEDLKNCKTINNANGACTECNEGYFLNEGDFKCTTTEFCYESTFGICNSCISGYYLDKKNDKCVESQIENCKQTLDGINCDICNVNFYLSENKKCSDANNCDTVEDGKCIKCIDNYFLSQNGYCTYEKNCKTADKDTGECTECSPGFYLDTINKKCKSNEEDEEFYYCTKADISCTQCDTGYFLGEDKKCTNTENCVESQNGKCLECKKNLYYTENGKCSSIEYCKIIEDNSASACDECIDGYYLDIAKSLCLKAENETFFNCKRAQYFGNFCLYCKTNYYNNRSDGLCYDNTDENDDFYRCEITDIHASFCNNCEKGYYLGAADFKCSKTEFCKYSQGGKCTECIDDYCLVAKNHTCVNGYLEETLNKMYIACNVTNEEGTRCAKCYDGYELNEDGYCKDVSHCEEKEGDVCKKCKKEWIDMDVHNYCYNSIFGCIRSYQRGCLKCDDPNDLYFCTECEPGYELTIYGSCKEIIN